MDKVNGVTSSSRIKNQFHESIKWVQWLIFEVPQAILDELEKPEFLEMEGNNTTFMHVKMDATSPNITKLNSQRTQISKFVSESMFPC